MDTAFSQVYVIPAINYDEFLGKIDAINRRAQKLGVPEVEVEVLGHEAEDGEVLAFEVKLAGQAPTVNGYTLIAHLEWREEANDGDGANKINHILDEPLPPHYRDVAPICEHCRANRRRLYTYVLRHEASGGHVQVGTTCIGDYTGVNDPHHLARWAELLKDAAEAAFYEPGVEYMGGGHSVYVERDWYLMVVAAVIEQRGWVSKSKAKYDPSAKPTVMEVADYLHDWRMGKAPFEIEDRHQERASAVVWYVANVLGAERADDLSDYEHNLVVALSGDVIHERDLALAASAMPYFTRALEKEREVEEQIATSEWVGEAGQRLDLRLKLVFVYESYNEWGPNNLHKFEDEQGNIYTWWTGSFYPVLPDVIDDEVWWLGRGTVKAHDEYNGVKQTVLTRCALESEDFVEDTHDTRIAKRG